MNLAKAVIKITVSLALMILTTTTIGTNGVNTVHAATTKATSTIHNPLTAKEEFDVTVTNVRHRDIIVGVTIDGLTQSQIIPGNIPVIAFPTSKTVIFQFDRHSNVSPPTALPIKLGDEWDPCIKVNGTTSSCLRASIDSLSQAQKKTLDTRYIPF